MAVMNKLLDFLEALSRMPGLGGLSAVSDRIRKAEHKVYLVSDEVEDFQEHAESAKQQGRALLGREGNPESDAMEENDDRTVLKPRGGGDDGGDRTVLRPRPGGRPAPGGRAPGRPAPAARTDSLQPLTVRGSGLSPLTDAGTELFAVTAQLRNTSAHPNPTGLRQQLAHKVNEFDKAARAAGLGNEIVLAARYSICTLVDETVLTTPWGSESGWSQQSLLSQFHNETWGGEKFFQMLDRAVREPAKNLDLLEFMYVCIALGLEGKYHVLDRGRSQLDTVQDNLYRAIRQQRGDYERELSPRWRGIEDRRNKLVRFIPLWAVGAFTGLLLLTVYIFFTYSLAKVSEPVYIELSKIGQDSRLAAPVPPVDRTLTLRQVLADDIKAKRCDVIEQARGSTVEIFSTGLFRSGSAEINAEIHPLLARIATAMDQFPGTILVTGHTDNQPPTGATRVKYPTNWDLSQARADSVAKLLANNVRDPGRLKAEGRGDTEPKGPNSTPAERAVNRRVEVTLLNGPGGTPPTITVPATDAAPATK